MIRSENNSTAKIAIFASGKGSNAQKIIDYFSTSADKSLAEISLIVSNKADAGVVDIAKKEKIPFIIIDKEKFFRGNAYVDELKAGKIDWIILAGFLWKIPKALIHAYPDRIVNIHPALLPKYGGKGMYGHHVHEAVIGAKERESGITIHFVDEIYDHGKVIFQEKCSISEMDTPDSLAKKISVMEHANYPRIIAELVGIKNIVKR